MEKCYGCGIKLLKKGVKKQKIQNQISSDFDLKNTKGTSQSSFFKINHLSSQCKLVAQKEIELQVILSALKSESMAITLKNLSLKRQLLFTSERNSRLAFYPSFTEQLNDSSIYITIDRLYVKSVIRQLILLKIRYISKCQYVHFQETKFQVRSLNIFEALNFFPWKEHFSWNYDIAENENVCSFRKN